MIDPGPPLIKDVLAPNFFMHQHELAWAVEDYRYLRQRRDQLSEKLKIGLVALNGASLVALLGALGGSGAAATWIGLTSKTTLWSAAAFSAGLCLAGHALNTTDRVYGREAADAYARMSGLVRLTSIGERPNTEASSNAYRDVHKEVTDLPLVGFNWSWRSIIAQSFAGGFWLLGIAFPLSSSLAPAWHSSWDSVAVWLGLK